MKKRKFMVGLLTAAMICSFPMSTFAAEAEDGHGADAPQGATNTEGAALDNTSTGAATITSDDGTTFKTENDDDASAKEVDENGADINVWAKVIDSSTPVYKLDVAWGAMKFEYSSGGGTWNTSTHTYDGATGTGAWTSTDYLDGTNNKITLTNHSNVAVDTSFAYAMTEQHLFNATADAASSVKGNFFDSNDKALTAALVLDDTANVQAAFEETTKVSLHSADSYYGSAEDKATGDTAIKPVFTDENKVTTGRVDDVYFAFSGKPDEGVGATLDTFTKVGVITVTVEKKADLTGFEF